MFAEKKVFRHASGKTKVGIVIKKILQIYTLNTYSDVKSYVIRELEIRHVVARESFRNRIFCMELKYM